MCDKFPQKFDVQTSTFVVNIKFPQVTYHTIVPSTKEVYCLNRNLKNFHSLYNYKEVCLFFFVHSFHAQITIIYFIIFLLVCQY